MEKYDDKVFVYGILRTGDEDRGAILPGYKKFYRTHATITADEDSFVIGELIDVNDEMLHEFDMIEGVDQGYYHKFRVTVLKPDGTEDESWVYQQVVDKNEEDV